MTRDARRECAMRNRTQQALGKWTDLLVRSREEADCLGARNAILGLVVTQGHVFGPAAEFVEACLSTVTEADLDSLGLGYALDVVSEIVDGEPDQYEVARGNTGIVSQCRDIVARYSEKLKWMTTSRHGFVVLGALELLWSVTPGDASLASLATDVSSRALTQPYPGVRSGLNNLLSEIIGADHGESSGTRTPGQAGT